MKRLLLHAPNIHTGGGLNLLRALLDIRPSPFAVAQFDERARDRLNLPTEIDANFVAKNLWSRLSAEWRLRHICKNDDVVLCFNNLPPLFNVPGKSVVFVQNRLLVERYALTEYALFVRARITMERLWLYARRGHPIRYVVQSPSMALKLQQLIGNRTPISVLPFIPESAKIISPRPYESTAQRFDFIYPASGDPHKNHATLIEAWRLLARSDIRPSLCLTIDPIRHAALASAIDTVAQHDKLNITNLGWLSSSELAAAYADSQALIYPSLVESFGLPLLEAARAGLPILAAERDYVRDVAAPSETFDPSSSLSIARAVRRHLKQVEEISGVLSVSDFVADILS